MNFLIMKHYPDYKTYDHCGKKKKQKKLFLEKKKGISNYF